MQTVNSRTHPSRLTLLHSGSKCKNKTILVKSKLIKRMLLAMVSRGEDQLTMETLSVSGVKRVSTQESPNKENSVTAGSFQQLLLLLLIQIGSKLCSQAKMSTPKTEHSKLDSSSEENQSMLLLMIEFQLTTMRLMGSLTTDHLELMLTG